MIHYLVTAQHAHTWQLFLQSWGSAFFGRVSILSYESVLKHGRLAWDRRSCFVFSDLDTLTLAVRGALAELHSGLCEALGTARVLNDPLRSLLRYELLRTLHAAELNAFAVYRLNSMDVPAKFPVIVRPERGSWDAALPLIADAAAYQAYVRQLVQANKTPRDFMAAEFLETADSAGVYRKYGAFVVGDCIVPRHVFFSRQWMVKLADLAAPELLAEELDYIQTNPHEEALRKLARIACISYGRIDYGVADGRIQVWEINTNPMIASAISSEIPERRAAHLEFLARFERAIRAFEQQAHQVPAP